VTCWLTTTSLLSERRRCVGGARPRPAPHIPPWGSSTLAAYLHARSRAKQFSTSKRSTAIAMRREDLAKTSHASKDARLTSTSRAACWFTTAAGVGSHVNSAVAASPRTPM
jgi:hypothetical protein